MMHKKQLLNPISQHLIPEIKFTKRPLKLSPIMIHLLILIFIIDPNDTLRYSSNNRSPDKDLLSNLVIPENDVLTYD